MPVLDANNNVLGYDQDYQSSNTDGAQGAKNVEPVLYNGGGPLTAGGVPSQQSFDRVRSVQGKATATAGITSTLAGDTALACAAGALSSVMPGQVIKLSGGTAEYVYVASTYVPLPTATSIPLQQPLVQAGNTIATWDTFSGGGAGLSSMIPTALPPFVMGVVDANVASLYRLLQAANTDTLSSNNTLAVAAVGYNGGTSERMRLPNVYKAFNAQAVTASSANTPTSIWTPTTGKKFRLMGYWFSTTAAAGLIFHDLAAVGGGGLLPIPSPIAAANGEIKSPNIGNGFLSAANNNQLWIDATVATTLTGFVYGTQE